MKLNRLFSVPLGMGSVFVPQRKEWIATAATTAVGLVGSLFGAGASARANRKAMKYTEGAFAKNYAQDLRDYYQNPTDRADYQNLLRKTKDFSIENWRKARGAQAVGGGTDASAQMAKDAGNKMMGDTVANIAAMNEQRKDRITARMQQNEMARANAMAQYEANKGKNIAEVAGALSNAAMQAGSAFEPNLKGNSNNSTEKDK